jgi:cobalt/nickel transport system permease protein
MRGRATEPIGRTWLHRVEPGHKLAAAFCILLGTALLPRRPDGLDLIPAGVLGLLWVSSRMPLVATLRRVLVAECFIGSLALLSWVAPGSGPLVLSALIKSHLCVLTLFLLTWTTPFAELLGALRRWHTPRVMLTTLALMYRYLPVLVEESKRMERARASRTFQLRRRMRWANLAMIVGQLFIRTADRAERIYLAMCARGWK